MMGFYIIQTFFYVMYTLHSDREGTGIRHSFSSYLCLSYNELLRNPGIGMECLPVQLIAVCIHYLVVNGQETAS